MFQVSWISWSYEFGFLSSWYCVAESKAQQKVFSCLDLVHRWMLVHYSPTLGFSLVPDPWVGSRSACRCTVSRHVTSVYHSPGGKSNGEEGGIGRVSYIPSSPILLMLTIYVPSTSQPRNSQGILSLGPFPSVFHLILSCKQLVQLDCVTSVALEVLNAFSSNWYVETTERWCRKEEPAPHHAIGDRGKAVSIEG